jgi:hypothetical protein
VLAACGKAQISSRHALPPGSDDLAGAAALFGALAHKVYEINHLLCLINTIFTQFAQSG